MSDAPTDDLIPRVDPAAIELLLAIRGGDVGTIRRLLDVHPDLPRWRIAGRKADGSFRTPLHMVTDWPGRRPAVSGYCSAWAASCAAAAALASLS